MSYVPVPVRFFIAWIRIQIELKSRIWIRTYLLKSIQIHNPALVFNFTLLNVQAVPIPPLALFLI
jgi:hypothetical protein